MSNVIKAPALQRGDKIGVVAPGSPVGSGKVMERIQIIFNHRGYGVEWGETARGMEGYLAGSDLARRADLERMWLDDTIGAIWCLRGGYGSIRLLPRLCFRLCAARPKVLIGFSDITALEWGFWSQLKLVTFHGPVLTTLGENEFNWDGALRAVSGGLCGVLDWPETKGRFYQPIKLGKACGRIMGGNLATIGSLVGTRFFPGLEGMILFLEETGEAAYRIDRMLTQLILAGVLDGVAAVMVGRCIPVAGESEGDLIKVFEERLGELGCPVGYGFPIGHGEEQWTVPQGVNVEVDMREGVLELREGAVV